MGLREMILVVLSIILISTITLSVFQTVYQNKKIQTATDYYISALSIAQQFIEEAKTKYFDEELVDLDPPSNIPGGFTSPSNLGPEGEFYNSPEDNNYDDFDDYNNLQFTFADESLKYAFQIEIHVNYISEDNHEIENSDETKYKKMEVIVSNNHLINVQPITLSYIDSYWGESR